MHNEVQSQRETLHGDAHVTNKVAGTSDTNECERQEALYMRERVKTNASKKKRLSRTQSPSSASQNVFREFPHVLNPRSFHLKYNEKMDTNP